MAKALLPWFGGAAGVWIACMLFFQVLLLGGYLYAHWAARLPSRAQAAAHILLLAVSITFLPVTPAARWKAAASGDPLSGILLVLAASVGLPFLLLSSTTPLVQSWYGRTKAVPYRLFAVSNLASLAALLAYPVAIEPLVPLRRQLAWWSAAYAVFAAICAAAAIAGAAHPALAPERKPVPARTLLLWMALAAVPSAMWLSVANYLSQNVAPVPFLWVLALGIYLLTLILSFDRDGWFRPRLFRWLLPLGWVLLAFCLGKWHMLPSLWLGILLFGAGQFLCSMFCHGELARRKPEPGSLTSYYLAIAAGGAAGGLFVAVLAPLIFTTYIELQVTLVACLLLAAALLYGYAKPRVLLRLSLVAAASFAVSMHLQSSLNGTRVKARNFYGTLEVRDAGGFRKLYHGSTLHGAQYLDGAARRTPTTYYAENSGIAYAIGWRRDGPRRLGVVGLGAGTLAAYGRPGDVIRFYEINPLVIRVAQTEFRFLSDSPAHVDIVPGDARLSLEREPDQNYDVLAVDAFSGDSIPMHLLTREAYTLYFRHLKPMGILALHVSNRYLDLASVAAGVARSLGRPWAVVAGVSAQSLDTRSLWVLVSADRALIDSAGAASRLYPVAWGRPWTDDYSNLFGALK